MSMNMLIAKLTEIVNEKKVWIFDKEECLLGMSKQLATIISDWDTQTDQMVQELYEARDTQVMSTLVHYMARCLFIWIIQL